jgi:hypothetical protein
MKLVKVSQTAQGDPKKLVAHFDTGKTIKFGSKNSKTFAEGASKEKQQAYLARHRVNENWSSVNPGSLSRYVLWSAQSISQGVKNFKNKFN